MLGDDLAVGSESGQATVEWVALVTIAAIALGALARFGSGVDGRAFGGLIARAIACPVSDCDRGEDQLARAYGAHTAELVRRHAPSLVYEPGERQLPVDWRECRAVECAQAPDDRELDAQRTAAGLRATVFTRVRRSRSSLYVQYWMYYPDSNTSFAGSDEIWKRAPVLQGVGLLLEGSPGYPGHHRDDWEAVTVRVPRGGGDAGTRVSSHGHWQWCKRSWCRDRWGPATGWARVSRGSHAGHVPVVEHTSERVTPAIPGVDVHERTTTADGIVLLPIESLDRTLYRRLDPSIAPPWEKEAYRDPEAAAS